MVLTFCIKNKNKKKENLHFNFLDFPLMQNKQILFYILIFEL